MFAFLWLASRGYRLAPWRSPYLQWRLETYTGIPAECMGCEAFLRSIWQERWSMLQYLLWVRRSSHLLKD
jgi:hypothetical protein